MQAVVRGRGRVSIRASDVDGEARTVATQAVEADGEITLAAKIDRFLDGGALWVEITTSGEPLTVEDLTWTVPSPAALRPVAVVICTFNRADDCANTLAAIAEDHASLGEHASSTSSTRAATGSTPGRSSTRSPGSWAPAWSTSPQPNLGGAGGFTRGLFEVTGLAGAEHANVVFMDDDVLCEPETVLRLNAFANRTVEPAIVGAQMLYLHPPGPAPRRSGDRRPPRRWPPASPSRTR